MVYLINHLVMFNTVEYQLTLLNDESQVIKLSNTAGRVLEELIRVHGGGETVPRATLFEKVWESQGLHPSNGNLNQQISLIRKALISLGLESTAIITLPKRGLKLNDHLIISPYDAQEIAPLPTVALIPAAGINETTSRPLATFFSVPTLFINSLVVIAMIITVLMIYFYFTINNKQPLFFFRKIDSCNIYTLRPITQSEQADFTLRVQHAMTGNIDHCDDQNIVLFSRTTVANPRVKEHINRRTFLAKCDRDSRGTLSGCQNFYFYNWGDQ